MDHHRHEDECDPQWDDGKGAPDAEPQAPAANLTEQVGALGHGRVVDDVDGVADATGARRRLTLPTAVRACSRQANVANFILPNAAGHYAYAHVQGSAPDGSSSGYVSLGPDSDLRITATTPEPTSMGLLGTGLAWAARRRGRRKN